MRFAALFLMAFLTACSGPAPTPRPQTGLAVITLDLAGKTLLAEVADTPQTEQIGLMFRESLPENSGMLFVYRQPQQMGFWMKNTSIPLSIAFMDAAGTIQEIHDMQPFDEKGIRTTRSDLLYALEMNQGWFKNHAITPGTKVTGLPVVKPSGE